MTFDSPKEKTIENLEILRDLLDESVDEGMFDPECHDYNELFDLLEEAKIVSSKEELSEVIEKAKALENQLDAWFSKMGKTTISLVWPEL